MMFEETLVFARDHRVYEQFGYVMKSNQMTFDARLIRKVCHEPSRIRINSCRIFEDLPDQFGVDKLRVSIVVMNNDRAGNDAECQKHGNSDFENQRTEKAPDQARDPQPVCFNNNGQETVRFPAIIASKPPPIITALKTGESFSSVRVSRPSETSPTVIPCRSLLGIGITSDAMPRISTNSPIQNKAFI
jgi:hypothetical protein